MDEIQGKQLSALLERYIGNKFLHKDPIFSNLRGAQRLQYLKYYAADDFGIGAAATALATTFGPAVIDWITDAVTTKEETVVNPVAQTTSFNAVNNAMGTNRSLVGSTTLFASGAYNYDAINLDYILATICPEEYSTRHPCKSSIKIAIANARFEVPFNVNINGAGAMYFFPQ
jgi:hypothetical protein